MIRIRFVTGNAMSSRLIRLQSGVSMPFTPSHTEALTQDGLYYIGAHMEEGVKKRPIHYDAQYLFALPDGSKSERIVLLDVPEEQEKAFYDFVESKIDTPYDKAAIPGFETSFHSHEFGHLICSAFMCQALRKAGFFRWPMTVPFHRISPRDLFLILSTHVEIDH